MIVDVVFGFLGSGKTTFIRRILERWGAGQKLVVLVNEFGEVGIDGELLATQGGNVVEMPSGCICCTLQADFRSQMLDISRKIRPERVIIEPTGVATIAQIRSIIEAQLFEDVIEEIHNIMIVDASGFMGFYKANRHFVESQVRNAHLALLNKCDKVEKKKALVIQGAISAINPEVPVLMTEFGTVDWEEYQIALSAAAKTLEGQWRSEGPFQKVEDEGRDAEPGNALIQPHFHEEEEGLGYEAFGCTYEDKLFDQAALERFFQDLKSSRSGMGEVVRAKGIFQVDGGFVLMELSSGEFLRQPIRKSSGTKVSIIGKGLDRERIGVAIERCQTPGNSENDERNPR